MSRQTIIEEAWVSYREECIPPTASHTQVVESRRAFYAGACTLFVGILEGLSPNKDVTDADVAALEDIKAELDEHTEMLKRVVQEEGGRQ